MAKDSEGRDKRSDDLFEDLDKFFAPIRDVDWPEEREGERPPGEADVEAEAPDPEDVPPAGAEAPSSGPPASQDVGPPTQELSALDQQEEGEEEEEEWDRIRSKLRGEEGQELEDEPAAGAGPQGEDPYRFMRDFLPQESADPERLFPEEEDEDAIEVDLTEGGAGDEGPGLGRQGEELAGEDLEPEPAELSLEDLRKAPDAYRDLPGPPEDEESPGVIVTPEPFGPERDEDLFPPEPDEPDMAAGAGIPVESVVVRPAGDLPPAAPVEEEPPPGGVEAAAEHFAEAIRESGELPVIGPDLPESEPIGPGPLDADSLDAGEEPFGPLPRDFEEPPSRTIKVGGAEGIGPSWQEPTSAEVATEAEEIVPPGGRNVPMAFLVGAILAAIGLGSVAISKAAFVVVAVVVVGLAQLELYSAIRRAHYHPAIPIGLAFGALTMVAGYLKGEPAMLAMVALAVPFTFLWYMALPVPRRKGAVANIGMTLFPMIYVPFLAAFLMMILAGSTALMLAVLGLAVGFDVAAYLFGSLLGGSWFGERGLAPTISPSKTWEGLIVAALIVILVSVAALANVDPISSGGRALALALVISVAAPLGDLAESVLKRDLGIKDMGSILPGHGGVLDRIDSVLFAAPLAFYLFRVFF